MAAAKKSKRTKKVTEIDEAKVTIEVEANDDEVEESKKVTPEENEEAEDEKTVEKTEEVEDKSAYEASESDSVDDKEEKEPEIENFDDESRFSWSKVFLFIFVAAITGFVIVGVYLFFIEGYNFSLSKEEAAEKTIDVKEELSPTPTPATVDKSAYDIEVLNGSGIAGEAANIQGLLEDEGFSVSDIGNADTADYTDTMIYYTKDVDQDYLDELEATLKDRGPVKLEEADSDQAEDVVVIVGSSLSEEEATPTPELE